MKPVFILGNVATAAAAATNYSRCHVLPSDISWPSSSAWNTFNATVNGNLIATVPVGSPCHDPNYDAAACALLQANWTAASTHYATSSSVMQEFWANGSCDPFTEQSSSCKLGNYVSYAVDVAGVDDIVSTLHFATKQNLRLVIRNTGHDYFGRSTGAGGLAIWTHNLKDTTVLDWSDANYTGKALRMGAGVQGFDAAEAAAAADLMIVGGECPSVGLAGGFLQGGGHSPLSTWYGMGADNLLQYEVVTASGAHLNASRTENSDLFWALSGGGGGTYAVVVSATVRAHPAATVGGGAITILAALTSQENFTAAVNAFHELLPSILDTGSTVSWELASAFFAILPITAINSNASYVENVVLGPWLARLSELGITPYQQSFTTLSYYDHYVAYNGPFPDGHLPIETYQFGSRLIPRSLLEDDPASYNEVVANVTASGVISAGSAAIFAGNTSDQWTSVHPAWRDAVVQLQLAFEWDETLPFDDNVAVQSRMTDEIVPQLAAVTPGGGAYLNEASFQEADWRTTFFGSNYDALLAIKRKWDPTGVFYAYKGVGSDAWTVATDGRMCRSS